MVLYANRVELETQAKRLGYEPDRDDTDADLVLAISVRSAGVPYGSGGEEGAESLGASCSAASGAAR